MTGMWFLIVFGFSEAPALVGVYAMHKDCDAAVQTIASNNRMMEAPPVKCEYWQLDDVGLAPPSKATPVPTQDIPAPDKGKP